MQRPSLHAGLVEYWADCNHDIATDGCEVNLRSDVRNCGECGNACGPASSASTTGSSSNASASRARRIVPRAPERLEGCIDLESDPTQLRRVRLRLPVRPNATPVCSIAVAASTECLPGTADCNGRDDDGCEVDLNKDPRNCGGCGTSATSLADSRVSAGIA